ncbi:hypothetical protein [Tepidibacillus fermentans]|uniref:Uncharacterized protein n=1 Tax=Tepidibacillus fermentans TaxID=1281767 RepID=A0A4R3K9C7_9BACI|nr:hypothetical protein [Tepidibacillus fermentans]TCS79557.1 hypothetical protein EDD72_12016 [Tepidibacillus fermentans]
MKKTVIILEMVLFLITLLLGYLYLQEQKQNKILLEIINEDAYGIFFSSLSSMKELEETLNQWIAKKTITLDDMDGISNLLQENIANLNGLYATYNKIYTKNLQSPLIFNDYFKGLRNFLRNSNARSIEGSSILLDEDDLEELKSYQIKLKLINQISNEIFPEEEWESIQDKGFFNDSRWIQWFEKSEQIIIRPE